MANNYTSFSFQVKCPSEETANRLEDSLAKAMNLDDERLNLEHAEAEGDAVWIAEEEGTDLEFLADVLQDYLRHNDPEGSIGFTWAETCSKLRVDEFGGGAVFITHDDQVWLNSYHWLQLQKSNRRPLPAPALAT
jgi:hypothetical protein